MQTAEASIIVPTARAGSVREAWALAYPTIIGMISTTVMWTVDTMLLGRIGKVELAAAGFGGVLIWTLYTFFVGIVQAVSTFVSQAQGGGRPRQCAVFAWQGLYLALGSGVILGLILWKLDWILALARPDAAVITECLRYARMRMLGATFVLGMFALASFFRGIGDVKTPMIVAILANLLNILLDSVLIFGLGPFPRLTTLGAGMATAIANAFGCLLILGYFLSPRVHRIYQSRISWRIRPREIMRLLRIGLPMGIQFFLEMGGFTVSWQSWDAWAPINSLRAKSACNSSASPSCRRTGSPKQRRRWLDNTSVPGVRILPPGAPGPRYA